MLKPFLQAFRTPDLRNKLLFTLFIIFVYRLGSFIPLPGVDYANVTACVNSTESSDILSLINLFSGGSLLQLSIFALGIMPYITSSIIIQILRAVIPHFETLYKEGAAGQTKLTQYSRYLTVGLAILQSATIIATARTGQLFGNVEGPCMSVIPDQSMWILLIMVISLTAGTSVIMWMGELISERGVGNGMSILIFTSICARFLPSLWGIAQGSAGFGAFFIVVLMIVAIVIVVVFVDQAQRRIPVQYPKRTIGNKSLQGQTTYIPLRINMAGVIPIIFASSFLAVPALIANFGDSEAGWVIWINTYLVSQTSWVYITLYELMIIGFSFFYVSITFNADDTADSIKKQGGFVPGLRAGKQTADYLRYVIHRLTTFGSLYLAVICLIPSLAMIFLNLGQQLPFGGTTILIIVGTGLETVRQINSQLQQHHYEGFMK